MATARGFSVAICMAAVLWAHSYLCSADGPQDTYSDSFFPNYGPPFGDFYGNPPQAAYGDFHGDPYLTFGDSYGGPHQGSYGDPFGNPYQGPYRDPFVDPYYPALGDSYGDSFQDSYGDSFGEPYQPFFDDSYGDSFQDSYGDSFDEPYQPFYDDVYGSDEYRRPEYVNPRFDSFYGPSHADPFYPSDIVHQPRSSNPASSEYCRGPSGGNGGAITSFPPTDLYFFYPATGQTFYMQGQIEAGTERFGVIYSQDTGNLRAISAVESRAKLDFGGRRRLYAMKTFEGHRTSCFITSFDSCADVPTSPRRDFSTLARTFFNYIFRSGTVTVPYNDVLAYRVTGRASGRRLAAENPAMAHFCEGAELYHVEAGVGNGPSIRIFNDQGISEIYLDRSYVY